MKKSLLFLLLLASCMRPEEAEPPIVLRSTPPDLPGRMMRQIRLDGQQELERVSGRLELDRVRGLLEERSGFVPLDAVASARIEVDIREEILEIEAGGDNLVTANFDLLPESTSPVITYRTGETERLVSLWGRGGDDRWRLLLGERVPMSVRIDTEGGYRELDFKHVMMTDLELRALKGNSVVSFAGDQPALSDISITHARGSISLDLSGDYESMQKVFLDTAVGDIAVDFSGYFTRLGDVKIITTNGDVDLSFTGAWQHICRIDITATCGNCRLKIPCGLGASIKVAECSDNVTASSMNLAWPSNAYVNTAYGKSEIFLDIRVRSAGGNIEVYSEGKGEAERGELLFFTTL